MGIRYIIEVKYPKCGVLDDDIYYAPTCDFTTHECVCGHVIDLAEYTGITYADASNLAEIEGLVDSIQNMLEDEWTEIGGVMKDIVVGGVNRYMLVTKYDDGRFGFMTTTLHQICALAGAKAVFAKDMEDFESKRGQIYMLIRGNVLVPEIKIKVGDMVVDV